MALLKGHGPLRGGAGSFKRKLGHWRYTLEEALRGHSFSLSFCEVSSLLYHVMHAGMVCLITAERQCDQLTTI